MVNMCKLSYSVGCCSCDHHEHHEVWYLVLSPELSLPSLLDGLLCCCDTSSAAGLCGGGKEPGLPPLRLLRESSGGALRLAHMALGDRHVMALMNSLDHLPGLTSIDIADNRYVIPLLDGLPGFFASCLRSERNAFVWSGGWCAPCHSHAGSDVHDPRT